MACLIALTALGIGACGSDSSNSSTSATPEASCKELCTKSGFQSSRVDNQPNEINCFCSGGAGAVADADCTSTCTGLGKKGQAFKSTGAAVDSCQCN